jgi:hypothetical protein
MEQNAIEQLKNLITEKPEILKALGVKKSGRPVGSKKMNVVEPGKLIEVIQPSETVSNEDPIPISATQAKKMLKRPRTYSEESRKKILENLQKGRDKLKALKEQKQAALKNEVDQARKEVVIKKYIVKPLQKKGEGKHSKVAKLSKQRSPEPESEDDESSVHATTDFESDAEIYKKLKRKERLIKKANKIQKLAKEPAEQKSGTAAPPVVPRQNPYNPFY